MDTRFHPTKCTLQRLRDQLVLLTALHECLQDTLNHRYDLLSLFS